MNSIIPSSSTSSSIINSQQILQKFFISQHSIQHSSSSTQLHNKQKTLRINLKLFKKISQQCDNYRIAIQLILILQKILYTGKKRLSFRQLIYKNSNSFRKSDSSSKGYSFTSIGERGSFYDSPNKTNREKTSQSKINKQASNKLQISGDKQQSKQSKTIVDDQKQQQTSTKSSQPHLFIADQITVQQKKALSQCLIKIKSNLLNTIYQNKINFILDQLLPSQTTLRKTISSQQQQIYKKMLTANNLGLDANKNNQIQQFITKGYQSLDGKFSSFQSLYSFLSNEVLPLIERKILSIPITSHQQRQSFMIKAINFFSEYFLHQFILQIKINKATLIQNRTFLQKIFKQNFKKHQQLITKNLTNILNQALLCPSNLLIQIPLFRVLKRMYNLWATLSSNSSSQFIQLKSDIENLGDFIKYPLMIKQFFHIIGYDSLKNISLYSKTMDYQDQLKEAAMFCYKILNFKEDLYLCNEIDTLSQMRFIKESKYFSSKAYAFSQQISKIYDTFDLKLPFWKYYKRVQRGQVWTYNILIQKPNSLLIWQFYLLGFDIGFGIYKVQSFKKHTIDQYNKEVECKQILKLQKRTVTQSQTEKGFLFLKNGFYKIVFDNSYSSFRGKDLSYMILQLQSEG